MFVDWQSLLGETTDQDMMLWYQAQRLQDRYISVLDTGRLEEWPELFTEDGVYEVVPQAHTEEALSRSIVYCCGRKMLRDRIASFKTNRFEPHKYRHMTSGLEITPLDADTIDMQSNYLVVGILANRESWVYQAGRYFDRLIRTTDGWHYQRKRAIYDASCAQTLLDIPI